MVKMTRVASAAVVAGLAVGGCLLGLARVAQAISTSDKPATIVVWPKIVVDTSGRFGPPTDTIIQLSSTARSNLKQAHCFYVNANSHCSDTGLPCNSPANCADTAACTPGWTEIDFNIVLTLEQPLGWRASEGLQGSDLPLQGPGSCDFPPGQPCFADFQCGGKCNLGQTNLGTSVPGVPEDPFIGTLTCIEFNPDAPGGPAPDRTGTNDSLKGEATILSKPTATDSKAGVDARKYNAIGLQSVPGAQSPNDNILQIGKLATAGATDPNQEYESCPSTLILNHLFDGASDPIGVAANGQNGISTTVTSDLTLVPCRNNFLGQNPGRVTAQFLVFNEFEQRFSTSRTVDCFLESQLSLLDTRNPTRSIFSAFVSGTIAGQTRIRGVNNTGLCLGGSNAGRLCSSDGDCPSSNCDNGRGLLGVAEMFVANTIGQRASTAYNLHQQGNQPPGTQADFLTIP